MMRRPGPVFLPPRGYRRRRLHDAARLVPVFGAVLFLLPVLWSPGETEARDTARDAIYLFVVWAGLVGVAALLSRGLSAPGPKPADDD
jgi:hypothetical protein